ncbi:hypothetical protein D3C78_1597200 [compost metagenome]
MRTEPAVLMAAASPWLNQAIKPALSELAKASTAIKMTARPARAGRELRSQRIMTVGLRRNREKHACRAPASDRHWICSPSLAFYL